MQEIDLYGLMLTCLKSIAVYVFMLFAIKIFGKKELAQLSVVDLVFILLISNSVQNAMVGSDNSLLGGMSAALALFIFNFGIKFLIKRFPNFSKAIQGQELVLIYKGKIQEHNLQKSMFSIYELKATIREHGLEKIEEVDLAILEVDGNISIMTGDSRKKASKKRKPFKKSTQKKIFYTLQQRS